MNDIKNISYIGLMLCLVVVLGLVFDSLVTGITLGIVTDAGLDRLKSKNQNDN